MSTYEDRAQRGAALLDANEPGWADKINLDTLDFFSEHTCAFAQIYGTFTTGRHIHGLNLDDARYLGLMCQDYKLVPDHAERKRAAEAEYAALHSAWLPLITARQTAPAQLPLAA